MEVSRQSLGGSLAMECRRKQPMLPSHVKPGKLQNQSCIEGLSPPSLYRLRVRREHPCLCFLQTTRSCTALNCRLLARQHTLAPGFQHQVKPAVSARAAEANSSASGTLAYQLYQGCMVRYSLAYLCYGLAQVQKVVQNLSIYFSLLFLNCCY